MCSFYCVLTYFTRTINIFRMRNVRVCVASGCACILYTYARHYLRPQGWRNDASISSTFIYSTYLYRTTRFRRKRRRNVRQNGKIIFRVQFTCTIWRQLKLRLFTCVHASLICARMCVWCLRSHCSDSEQAQSNVKCEPHKYLYILYTWLFLLWRHYTSHSNKATRALTTAFSHCDRYFLFTCCDIISSSIRSEFTLPFTSMSLLLSLHHHPTTPVFSLSPADKQSQTHLPFCVKSSFISFC